MGWSDKAKLAVVELAIYLLFIPAVVYTLAKHRLPSILGHIFFFIFISLRIITDGLTIHERNDASPSETALIINSVGLSPLLLTSMGFITEVRSAQITAKPSSEGYKISIIVDLLMHIVVVSGVALMAIGLSNEASAKTQSDVNSDRDLADAGVVLLLLAWLAICVWAFFTFTRVTTRGDAGRQHLPRRLIKAILVALPFLGVRVLYSVVYVTSHNSNINPENISFAGYFFLVFLSQLLCAAVLLIGLITTKNMVREKAQHQQPVRSDGEFGLQEYK